MRNAVRALLAIALLLGMTAARAENTLQGLEMDVMEPGETAAHATARIVLPRPRSGVERSAEYPGLDTEQSVAPVVPDGGNRLGISDIGIAAPGTGPADGAIDSGAGGAAVAGDQSGEPGG